MNPFLFVDKKTCFFSLKIKKEKKKRKLKSELIALTFHGFPGSNSGTKSVNADAGDACDDGQSLLSLSCVVSGQPSLTFLPDDHVLMKRNGEKLKTKII